MIHLGGTPIAGVLVTMDAVQGVRALRLIRPRVAIPVHFDDYEVFRSPLADFRDLAERSGLETTIHYLDRGETYVFGRGSGSSLGVGESRTILGPS
ncbi:MAG: metal-dependent hydrolase [Acidimicrobiales bacterium]|nr:metal-dependent hydrolase [Acidimicrobiales bacterium]